VLFLEQAISEEHHADEMEQSLSIHGTMLSVTPLFTLLRLLVRMFTIAEAVILGQTENSKEKGDTSFFN